MPEYCVIFDMDGVLVDSYRAHRRSWQDTARHFRVSLTEQDFARTFGRTSREIIQSLWPSRFDDQQILQFDSAKEQRFREILESNFPEMPRASDLIQSLRDAECRLAIGSSGPPENVALVMRLLRAGKLFDATVTGAEVKHGKPNPDVFLLAARKLGVDPSQCAVIEDAIPGLEAARRAGMVAIALTGTAPRDRLEQHADEVVDSLGQLTPQRIQGLIDRS